MTPLRESSTSVFLKIISAFQILYNGFIIFYVIGVKIFTFPAVQRDISAVQIKLADLQVHLRGLGLQWVDIDEATVSGIMHGLLWVIFVIGFIWAIAKFSMAVILLLGVFQGDIQKLTIYILFGFVSLGLDILAYPLAPVICSQRKGVVGSLCDPSGNSLWLMIPIKIIEYLSIILAWVLRKRIARVPIIPSDLTFSTTLADNEILHKTDTLV